MQESERKLMDSHKKLKYSLNLALLFYQLEVISNLKYEGLLNAPRGNNVPRSKQHILNRMTHKNISTNSNNLLKYE